MINEQIESESFELTYTMTLIDFNVAKNYKDKMHDDNKLLLLTNTGNQSF